MARIYKTGKTVLRFYSSPFRLLDGITSNTPDSNKNAFLDDI